MYRSVGHQGLILSSHPPGHMHPSSSSRQQRQPSRSPNHPSFQICSSPLVNFHASYLLCCILLHVHTTHRFPVTIRTLVSYCHNCCKIFHLEFLASGANFDRTTLILHSSPPYGLPVGLCAIPLRKRIQDSGSCCVPLSLCAITWRDLGSETHRTCIGGLWHAIGLQALLGGKNPHERLG